MQTPTTARQIRRRISGLRSAITRWERAGLTGVIWGDSLAKIEAARAEIDRLDRELPGRASFEQSVTELLWGNPAA